MENKFLIIIVAILIIVVGVGGYYAYGSYQTTQMDKYMKQANGYADTSDNLTDEANSLADQNRYDEALTKLDEAIWNYNQSVALTQKAYQNANGPYKDLLSVGMKKQKVYLEMLYSWESRLQYIINGDYVSAAELKKTEENRLNDLNKYDDDYESIKAQNPGMQEHIDNNW